MSTPNKKRRIISLDVKKQILEAAANKKPTELSKKFDLPTSTVKTILGDRVAILRAVEEGGDAKRTRLYPVKHEDVEMGLFHWFKEQRSKNTPTSGLLLMIAKAKKAMSNLEKVVENAVADDVNQDCEKVVMQQISTSLAEKIKAKKKVLETQIKPALDSFNEISSKAEHLEKKRRAVEITFTKLFQEFEPIEDALDSAKEGYADVSSRLFSTESSYDGMKAKINSFCFDSLFQKAGEDGQILARGLEEAHTLIRKCNALETKNNILRPQMEAVISEHDRLKKEYEESDAKHKQLLTLLAQKKAEYESLIPPTRDGSLNTSTPRKEAY